MPNIFADALKEEEKKPAASGNIFAQALAEEVPVKPEGKPPRFAAVAGKTLPMGQFDETAGSVAGDALKGMGQTTAGVFVQTGKDVLGLAEGAAATISGIPSFLGGLAATTYDVVKQTAPPFVTFGVGPESEPGEGRDIFHIDWGRAKRVKEEVNAFLGYEPMTEEGATYASLPAAPFELYAQGVSKVGGVLEEKAGIPQEATEIAGEAALLGMGAAFKGAKAAIPKGRSLIASIVEKAKRDRPPVVTRPGDVAPGVATGPLEPSPEAPKAPEAPKPKAPDVQNIEQPAKALTSETPKPTIEEGITVAPNGSTIVEVPASEGPAVPPKAPAPIPVKPKRLSPQEWDALSPGEKRAYQEAYADYAEAMERYGKEKELLAKTDDLTGAQNGRALKERIAQSEVAGEEVYYASLDIDKFKKVQQKIGNRDAGGDAVIKSIFKELKEELDPSDIFRKREGGDEWVVRGNDPAALETMLGWVRKRTQKAVIEWRDENGQVRKYTGGFDFTFAIDRDLAKADAIRDRIKDSRPAEPPTGGVGPGLGETPAATGDVPGNPPAKGATAKPKKAAVDKTAGNSISQDARSIGFTREAVMGDGRKDPRTGKRIETEIGTLAETGKRTKKGAKTFDLSWIKTRDEAGTVGMKGLDQMRGALIEKGYNLEGVSDSLLLKMLIEDDTARKQTGKGKHYRELEEERQASEAEMPQPEDRRAAERPEGAPVWTEEQRSKPAEDVVDKTAPLTLQQEGPAMPTTQQGFGQVQADMVAKDVAKKEVEAAAAAPKAEDLPMFKEKPKTPSGEADVGGYDLSGVSPEAGKAATTVLRNTAQAVELPEIVNIFKQISGKYPQVVRKLRGALGRFTHGANDIKVLAELSANPGLMERVLAHEAGHFVDTLPKDVTRGNILGHLATLSHNFKKRYWPMGEELTKADMQRISAEAKAITAKEKAGVVEEAIPGVTPDDIRAIWNDNAARAKYPDLYNYIANLSGHKKASILKEAMKGVVDAKLEEHFAQKKNYVDWAAKEKETFHRLLDAELKKRRVYDAGAITEELKNLSMKWKPFDPAANASMTKYRFSAKELYADAMSVLFNDPKLLMQEAPQFYAGFLEFLHRKPEFQKIYSEMQERIMSGRTWEYRDATLDAMFDRGEEAWKNTAITDKEKLWPTLKDELWNVASVLKEKFGNMSKEYVGWEEMIYGMSEAEAHMSILNAGVLEKIKEHGFTEKEIGKALMMDHIVLERSHIANPGGFTKTAAEAHLAGMAERMGPERWAALVDVVEKFREARKPLFSKMRESQMFSKELMDKIEDNVGYATMQIVKWMEEKHGSGETAHIYRQYGTFEDAANPLTATIMKDLSIIHAINRNKAKVTVLKGMREMFPQEIRPAKTRWDGKRNAIVESRDPKWETMIFMRDGKTVGFDVTKRVAQTFDMSPWELSGLTRMLAAMNKPFRDIFINYNPGFTLFNALRDFRSGLRQLPGKTPLGAPGPGFVQLLPYWGRGYKAAARSLWGKKFDPKVQMMLEEHSLITSLDYAGMDKADTQLNRMLSRFGMRKLYDKPNHVVVKFLKAVLPFLERVNQTVERGGKVGADLYLRDKFPGMPAAERAHRVRRVGSPPFLVKGRATPLTNNLFLFENAFKRGWEAQYESFRESPAAYAYKVAKFDLVPKLVQYGITAGLLGWGLKSIMDGASEYDKTNYTIIPLGMTENGKSVYFRIPHDETGRVLGGVFWKGMVGIKAPNSLPSILDYTAGQMPMIAPPIGLASDAIQYFLLGQNPQDRFRGTSAVPETIFDAHDYRSVAAFVKYMSQKAGLNAVYKFKADDAGLVESKIEKVVGLPIASNLLGRFLRVSDKGLREELQKPLDELRVDKARQSLDLNDALGKLIAGKTLDVRDIQVMLERKDTVNDRLLKMMQRRYGDAFMKVFSKAKTNEEMLVVIEKYLDIMSKRREN